MLTVYKKKWWLGSSVADPDVYQAKTFLKTWFLRTVLTSLWLFELEEWCKCTSVPIRIRIRIRKSEVWIRGPGSASGSSPKCYGSPKLMIQVRVISSFFVTIFFKDSFSKPLSGWLEPTGYGNLQLYFQLNLIRVCSTTTRYFTVCRYF